MFHYEDFTNELEQEGRVETTIVGLRYVGPKSTVAPTRARQQGGWPGNQTFQGGDVVERNDDGKVTEQEPGPVQVGVNPDWMDDTVEGGSLAGLEALSDFEVIYDEATLAQAMLDANYLPPDVFGSPGDQTGGQRTAPDFEIRQAVFDFFDGLEDRGSGPNSHQMYREQLADVAGVEIAGEGDSPTDSQRAQQYVDNHTRAELKDAVEELREGPDDISLQNGKSDFAEWLAKQDAADVRAVLDDEGEE